MQPSFHERQGTSPSSNSGSDIYHVCAHVGITAKHHLTGGSRDHAVLAVFPWCPWRDSNSNNRPRGVIDGVKSRVDSTFLSHNEASRFTQSFFKCGQIVGTLAKRHALPCQRRSRYAAPVYPPAKYPRRKRSAGSVDGSKPFEPHTCVVIHNNKAGSIRKPLSSSPSRVPTGRCGRY